MDEAKIKQLTQNGRKFMHRWHDEEEEFISDQMKKLPQPPLVKAQSYSTIIDLPKDFANVNTKKDFLSIVNGRKSNRVFTQESMSIAELSYILWVCQGIKEIRGNNYATLRTVPSAGARHGFETYIIVLNVVGLKNGKYHYLPMKHALEFMGEEENVLENVSESLVGQAWANKAGVVLYFSCVAYRCEWRYGIHAHRPALIDAGHVGQNVYLACSALDLGTCAIAALDSKRCDAMFALDGEEEFVVYAFPIGKIREEDKAKEDAFYAFLKEE